MSAARELVVDERWDKAVSKAEEAAEMFPERTEVLDLIHEIQRTKAFKNLFNAAQQAYSNGRWDEAISKAEEADSICPNNSEIRGLIDLARGKKREAEQAAEKSSKPLSEVIQGNKSAGNLVGTTVKWLKFGGRSFGQPEYDAFIGTARQLPKKELTKLKSKLSGLTELIGQDTIDKIINVLNL